MQSILEMHKMIRVLHVCAYPIVFISFYGLDWQKRVFKVMKKIIFKNIFISSCLFHRDFGQVNEWPLLKLYEMIRVLHILACPIIFILFDD